jgi:hypothetical protein
VINNDPGKIIAAILFALVIGGAFVGIAEYFIFDWLNKKNKKRITPFIQSILSRYTDLMYDEKYSRVSDREFIKLLRDTALVMLWLVIEASVRLTRRMEKEAKKE